MMVWYGRLLGPTWFGCPWCHSEIRAAVLQRDAGARHHHAGAEAHVVGLDHRHHDARGVGGGEIHRSAARCPGRRRLGAVPIDQRRALAQVLLVEQVLRAHRHVVDVGHIGLRVGEGELHRFDLQMHAVGGIDWERGHVEVFEDPEGDQRDDALPVGRYLVHGVPAVGAGDRADPVGMVCGEVAGPHGPAVGRRVGFEFRRQFAAVERLAVGCGDHLERGGVVGQCDQFAGLRRPAAGHECLGESWLGLEQRDLRRPLLGDRR